LLTSVKKCTRSDLLLIDGFLMELERWVKLAESVPRCTKAVIAYQI